jgi:succinate dehydrogenase / fumarate reductase, cytochrome b subunit
MHLAQRIWQSSLGKKYLMALSGLVLVAFVIGHLLGNLQIFLGREVINRYGHFLQTTPELVWPARVALLVTVVLHIVSAITLARQNRAARPVSYAQYEVVASTYASRTMVMSGVIIFAFIVYHLLHFTFQLPAVNLTGSDFRVLEDARGQHDIYAMMVSGFKNPIVSGFYLIAMGLLCLHLSHGISSLFQSLGLNNRLYEVWLGRLAVALATAIFLGYCSIPAAVLLGIVN